MRYSHDFFKQRSFEVVWAIFRVAQRVSRPHFARVLEERGMAYLSSKKISTLDGLYEVVDLGMKIGEINDVNGKVLMREIGLLRTALNEHIYIEREQKEEEGNVGVVEDIFSKPPMLFSEFAQKLEEVPVMPLRETEKSPEMVFEKSGNDFFEIAQKEEVIMPDFSGGENNEKSPEMVFEKSGNESSEYSTQEPMTRGQIILSLLEKKSMCHINDIKEVLNGVTDRTLRNDVKNLIDQGLIMRVGTGGPSSFLRLRNKK